MDTKRMALLGLLLILGCVGITLTVQQSFATWALAVWSAAVIAYGAACINMFRRRRRMRRPVQADRPEVDVNATPALGPEMAEESAVRTWTFKFQVSQKDIRKQIRKPT